MSVKDTIEGKLDKALPIQHLEVINESHKHNVPEGSESHFKLVVVSEDFSNRKLIERHRLINGVLREELAGQVHALALHTYTSAEWKTRFGEAPMSPPCQGGGA
ncbi:MAG: BolA/IbaG family iron-sulfur metabolism protein [Gammaproteobacteria bacterium]|nr:BolA/IbaG family iron-sulfur metabolism protein [Gammaproteobacteria bacterium]